MRLFPGGSGRLGGSPLFFKKATGCFVRGGKSEQGPAFLPSLQPKENCFCFHRTIWNLLHATERLCDAWHMPDTWARRGKVEESIWEVTVLGADNE